MGDDFQIYDVDSIQCAKYNFFLMKDPEYVGVITLGYYNQHWEYAKGNSEHVLWNKMNMLWREKKKQAEKEMKELVNMTVACKYYNEDDGKQVNYVGGTSITDKEQKKDTASVAIAGCCILGVGCAGVIIRKRGGKV